MLSRTCLLILWAVPLVAQTKKTPEEELLLTVRSEPVELEAYAFQRVVNKLPAVSASAEAARLRQRAGTAQSWYPRLPRTTTIPLGYSGLVAASKLGLSGLEIDLGSVHFAPAPPALERRLLAELPHTTPKGATCESATFETRLPIFWFVAENWDRLFPNPNDQMREFADLSAQIDSAFDLANFADLVVRVADKEKTDVTLPLSYIESALDKLGSAPVSGAAPLQTQFGFGVAMEKALARARDVGLADSMLAKYRQFAVRSIGQPICKKGPGPDPLERSARRKLADSVNRAGALIGAHSFSPISTDEMAEGEAKSTLLDAQPPVVDQRELDDFVHQAMAIAKSDHPDQSVSEYVAHWARWEPQAEQSFLAVDQKFAAMELLRGVESAGHRPAEELVSYLAGAKSFKLEHPDLWLAYVQRVLDTMTSKGVLESWGKELLARAQDLTLQFIAKLP